MFAISDSNTKEDSGANTTWKPYLKRGPSQTDSICKHLRNYSNGYVKICDFNASTNSWNTSAEKTITNTNIEYLSSTNFYRPKESDEATWTFTGLKFVRVICSLGMSSGYEMYYTGTYSGDGSYNLLYPNGSGNKSMAVLSDAPVFVHTVTTSHSYEECSQWSEVQWECAGMELPPKGLSFSDNRTKRYDIPVSSIDSGDCYVVIAHYADDSTLMSQVMQR